jgi:hypothetical protein
MTPDEAIAELYRREVNCGCETFFDAGITLWIGDQTNGRYSQTQLPRGRFDEAGDWLINEAKRVRSEAFE